MPSQFKVPFKVDLALRAIRKAVRFYQKAALFALRNEGYSTCFEQLIACVISIRTRDEATVPTVRNLFKVARSPADLSRLGVEEIDRLIQASTFHEAKARTIHRIASETDKKYGSDL